MQASGLDARQVEDVVDDREEVLRFSLAGVQLKFSAINEASGGLTIPAKGVGGSWIVKLPVIECQTDDQCAGGDPAKLVGFVCFEIREVAPAPPNDCCGTRPASSGCHL